MDLDKSQQEDVMAISIHSLSIGCLAAFFAVACGAPSFDGQMTEPESGHSSPNLRERLIALDHDIELGAAGEDVRALHGYLTEFGYFPNQELAREYPSWRPLVSDGPAEATVFDQHTVEAIRLLQRRSGLTDTGIVDEPTRATLKLPRCGVPDGIAAAADPSNKWSLRGWPRLNPTVKWWFENDTFTFEHKSTVDALNVWAAAASLTFSNQSASPDIIIRFGDAGGNLGKTCNPIENLFCSTPTVTMSNAVNWYYGAGAIGSNQVDFQSVVEHEVGHALGFGHSGFGCDANGCYTDGGRPIMRSGLPNQTIIRTLAIDDRVAVNTWYDAFQGPVTSAVDVGAGLNGDVWIVGTDHMVRKWNGSSFVTEVLGGDASRIAVAPDGRPWVIAGWGDGSIWRRTTNDPATGAWEPVPGGGCARDIGVGGEGIGLASVWVIGCNGPGPDGAICKFMGDGWACSSSGGAAMRITVDDGGKPWVLSANGVIYRYSTNSPFTGTWSVPTGGNSVPSTPTLAELAISVGNYAFATHSFGGVVDTYQNQPAGPGDKPAPALNQWTRMAGISYPGGGKGLAVTPQGEVWLVNNSNSLYKTVR
jgi:peptidoglycan hydrolase-like protein with peptidoglycan-binding domain